MIVVRVVTVRGVCRANAAAMLGNRAPDMLELDRRMRDVESRGEHVIHVL
jgi:hypothetical protein